jgi:predicted HicB family RNase H-like nuclease
MARSSASQLAQRINAALDLLKGGSSNREAVAVLVRRYRVSKQQARRYLEQAQRAKRKLPVPEEKMVFTVKLPVSLTARLRQRAESSGKSLSDLTTQALEAFLRRGRHG